MSGRSDFHIQRPDGGGQLGCQGRTVFHSAAPGSPHLSLCGAYRIDRQIAKILNFNKL